VSLESILLALVNAIRPAGLAAVYALLGAPEPRRLLLVYIAAGFAWSVTVGLLVVLALHGAQVAAGTSTASAVVSLGLGAAGLGFAAAFASGRVEPRAPSRSVADESRMARALRAPSLRVAAGAGIATHLPGLMYLLGLNSISSTDPGLILSAVDVLAFNMIWFSIPAAALVVSLRRPDLARKVLDGVNDWVRSRQRLLAILVFSAAGAYFAVKGATALL
jgi:hypothetical protein